MNRQKHLAYGLLFLGIAEVLYPSNAAAQSLPSGFGSATNVGAPGTVGNTMTVNVTGPRAYAEWLSFNVAPGFTFDVTNTTTPNNYIFVNRVTGGTLSDISGLVRANGNLWLINPNGISVGSTGIFDVGGLLLSTATTLNGETEATNGAAFLAGATPTFTLGGATSGIAIQPGAQLTADIGAIALIANSVLFRGRADAGAGEVALVGAQGVSIGLDSDLNAISQLQIDAGSNQSTGVDVASASFNGARTYITAAGMNDGQGNVILGNGVADNIRFDNGEVVLYTAAATGWYGPRSVVSGGVVQQLPFSYVGGTAIRQRGRITTPGNLSIHATGGFGDSTNDTDVRAAGNLTIRGSVFGRDVALSSGGVIDSHDIRANDDLVLRGTNGLTTRQLQSGVGTTDVSGSADALAGTALAGFDMDISGGTGLVDVGGYMPLVPGDYTVTGGDFTNGAFQPNFMGGTFNSFTINDTAFGLTLGTFSAPGMFTINVLNGGNLAIANGYTVSSQNGDVRLTTSGGGSISVNGTVSTGFGRGVTLNSSGNITEGGGSINSTNLFATAVTGLALNGTNQVDFATLSNTGTAGFLFFASQNPYYRIQSASTVGGNMTITANNGVTLGGPVSAGTDVRILGPVRIDGTSIITAGNTVQFSSTVTGVGGAGILRATSGAGTYFAGDISGLNLLAVDGDATFNGTSVTTTGGIDLDDVTVGSSGSLTFTTNGGFVAGDITSPTSHVQVEGGTVNVGGITAGDTTTLRNVSLRANTGSLTLGSASTNALSLIGNTGITATGAIVANTLSGNSANGTATLDGANRVVTLADFSANGFTMTNIGDLTLSGPLNGRTGDVRLATTNGNLTIGSLGTLRGNEVVLSTDRAFINQNGASAITASNRWLVYSAAPGGNTFGNLDSGATALWNATLGTRAPSTIGPGNRYVFAYQPTLTFASTNLAKTYGTDATPLASSLFTVSGFQPGVAGAFLGDTAASAFTGAPLLASTGFGDRASVAGSPYAISIANGTLASNSGYAFVFDGSGVVNVTPLAITGTPGIDAKTYDGNTNATGNIVLNGVLAGDDVGAAATFTFLDDNAGTSKTVTIAGATLTGTDAGNYTLTLPATALGDILQRALAGTVTIATKTYDGNRSGTGTISLGGVVAGDDVGATATFTFDDKNAGTSKTVTIAGATLTGSDAGNYTLTLPATALGDILQRAITGTVTVAPKTYDGNTQATGTITLTGTLAGDDIGAGATFTYLDKNAGTAKTVNITGATLTGADSGNYTLTLSPTALGNILQRAITGTVTVDAKTYDGGTTATGDIALGGVVAGDDVAANAVFAFLDKNAGNGKTVTISGVALSGADAGNYTLSVPASTLGDILRKALAGTVVVDDKVYDGTSVGTGTVSLSGVVAGDNVGATGTYSFADANAGNGKSVAVDVRVAGTDAGNYTLVVPGTTIAAILQRAITVTADPTTKPQGSADPAFGWTITDGTLVGADTLSGLLTRDPGEAPGTYAITQGTLSATSNYRLTFVGNSMTITSVLPPTNPPPDPHPDTHLTRNDDTRPVLDRLSSEDTTERATALPIVDCRAEHRDAKECEVPLGSR